MPKLKKKVYPSQWDLVISAAAGPSINNFFVLSDSSEYNEAFAWKNPDTFQSPTSYFTHILHYKNKQKQVIYRMPDRLLDIWYSPIGKAFAGGFPRGLFEIDSNGCQEIVLKGHTGTFVGIWGANEEHIFACGFEPFILYRRLGKWSYLTLPEGIPQHLHSVVGFNERDVYFVGAEGTVLHFDGQQLRRLEIPTTNHLLSICILNDKHLCIGGVSGTLLHGNQKGWRLVPTGTEIDLYSLAHFQSQVCFPSPEGIWAYDGHKRPALLIDTPAEWVSGLGDGIVFRDGADAWVYDGVNITKLDTTLYDSGP